MIKIKSIKQGNEFLVTVYNIIKNSEELLTCGRSKSEKKAYHFALLELSKEYNKLNTTLTKINNNIEQLVDLVYDD